MAIRKVIPRSLDSAAASANLSFDANTLFVDSTNNVVGINTATPNSFATGLAVYNATNPSVAIVSGNANAYLRLYSTSDTDMYLSNVSGAMNFVTAGTTKMYLSSAGNVGIGTTTIATNFRQEIVGLAGSNTSAASSGTTQAASAVMRIRPGGGFTGTLDIGQGGGTGSWLQSTDTANLATTYPLILNPVGGNVGIGTGSPSSKLDIFTSSGGGSQLPITLSANNSASAKTNYTQIGFGIAQGAAGSETGGFELKSLRNNTSVYLADYEGAAGAAKWRFYTEGTERMRIDTSGNVGFGTASPLSQIHSTKAGASLARFTNSLSNGGDWEFKLGGGGFEDRKFMLTDKYGSTDNVRLAVDSSGNVGIGIPSPAYRLDVGTDSVAGNINTFGSITSGTLAGYSIRTIPRLTNDTGTFENTYIGCGASVGNIIFQQGNSFTAASNTERMRLDTVGRLMLGYLGTSARASAAKLELKSPASTALSIYMFKTDQVEVNMGFAGSTDTNFYINSGSTTVGASGVYLTNNGTSWNAVSDERMKTIIEPITNAAEKVSSLRTVIGYYNNDEKQIRHPFLIAQDVQSVLPEAVNVQNVETGTLGMSYTDVIPLMVAAIKELKAIVDAQAVEIAALKAK